MVNRLSNYVGKRGTDISLRMIVVMVIFTIILIVLIFLLKLFYPNTSILENAYAVGSKIF